MGPLEVTADHVKLYKRALLEAGMARTTVAQRLSVLRGTYSQLAAKGLLAWETAQDIATISAPKVQKNCMPALMPKQAVSLLEAIPRGTLQGARNLETDGIEHYLHVTEKRSKRARKILHDRSLLRQYLDRKTPWRLVKPYRQAAGIEPDGLGRCGIGVHSLRKTAINDAIRNGAQMHEVSEFAGHSDIRTTELHFVRKDEDGEMAARRIQIRLTRR